MPDDQTPTPAIDGDQITPALDTTPDVDTKTFTQEEVTGLVTKESRKAVEKVLKDLGVEDVKNAKEGLAKFRELQDKDKTELEKAIEQAKAFENQLTEKDSEVNSYKTQLELVKSGVPSDKLERYTKLLKTYDGDSMEDNIKALLEEFPVVVEETPKPNIGGKTAGSGGATTKEQLLAIARKNMSM